MAFRACAVPVSARNSGFIDQNIGKISGSRHRCAYGEPAVRPCRFDIALPLEIYLFVDLKIASSRAGIHGRRHHGQRSQERKASTAMLAHLTRLARAITPTRSNVCSKDSVAPSTVLVYFIALIDAFSVVVSSSLNEPGEPLVGSIDGRFVSRRANG